MKAVRMKVHGQVQGVFYRHHTKEQAHRLGISGFVRNESDGSVYIEAEGEDQAVADFINWTRNGSPKATVEKVEVEEGRLTGVNGFVIQ